jgi:hypothetical protein
MQLDPQIIDELIRRIVEVAHPLRVILLWLSSTGRDEAGQ